MKRYRPPSANYLYWLALLLALALLGGCGGSRRVPDTAGNNAGNGAALELAQALSELDALKAPAGADPALFAQLKQALRAALQSSGRARFASAAPDSTGSQIADLSITDSGGSALVSFRYRCQGDYDQNSQVGLSDITPIALHFGKNSAAADWGVARSADGDANGEISLGDITPIGVSFNRTVQGYRLEFSASGGAPWASIADIPFSASTVPAGASRRFDYAAGSLANGYYRVTPYDGTSSGIPSNPVIYPAVAGYYEVEDNDDPNNADMLPPFPFPMPLVRGSLGTGNPPGDYDGDDLDWFAFQAAEAGPVELSCGFDGSKGDIDLLLYVQGVQDPVAVSQSYADVERVGCDVVQGNYYFLAVRLYSGYGEYQLAGKAGQPPANQAPGAALSANPGSGGAPLTVTLDASGSSDPDGTITGYEFDFGEGGGFQNFGAASSTQHQYTAGGTFTARVRVTDNGGLSDIATAQVDVQGSGPGSASGSVLTNAGHGLAGVSLVLSDGGSNTFNASSGAGGSFSFASVPQGTYILTPSKTGTVFDPPSRPVNIAGGALPGLDFTASLSSGTPAYPFYSGTYCVHPALDTTIDIYVEPGTGVNGYQDYMRTACIDAIPRWNIAGDPWGLFHVQFTDNINSAEIWIHWVESLGGSTAGVTYFSGTSGQIDLPMEIQLACYVGGNVIIQSGEEMVALHEAGHALGLWGHSPNMTDVMYPVAMQPAPSALDIWTLYTCFHTPADFTTGGRGSSALGKRYEFRIE